MTLSRDQVVIDAANAINRYLLARPNASETVDGVAKWWLLRQRYVDSRELVQQALDFLLMKGFIVKTEMPDGKVLYSKAENKEVRKKH